MSHAGAPVGGGIPLSAYPVSRPHHNPVQQHPYHYPTQRVGVVPHHHRIIDLPSTPAVTDPLVDLSKLVDEVFKSIGFYEIYIEQKESISKMKKGIIETDKIEMQYFYDNLGERTTEFRNFDRYVDELNNFGPKIEPIKLGTYSDLDLTKLIKKCTNLSVKILPTDRKIPNLPGIIKKLESLIQKPLPSAVSSFQSPPPKSSPQSASTPSKSITTFLASSQVSPSQVSSKPFYLSKALELRVQKAVELGVQSAVKPKPDYYDPKDTPGGYVPSFNPFEASPGKPSWQKNSDTPGGYEPSFKDNPILRFFQTSEGVTSVEAKEAIFKLPDYTPIELPPFSGVVTAAPATVVDGRDFTPGGYVPYSSDSLGSEGDASSLGQKVATPGGYNPYGSTGGGESQWTASGVGYPTDGSGSSSSSTQPSAYDRSGGDVGSSGIQDVAISSGYNPDGSSAASDSYGTSSIQGTGESRLAGLAEISDYSFKDFLRGGVYSPQTSAYGRSDAGGGSSLPTDIATPGGYIPYGSSSGIGESQEVNPAAINDRY